MEAPTTALPPPHSSKATKHRLIRHLILTPSIVSSRHRSNIVLSRSFSKSDSISKQVRIEDVNNLGSADNCTTAPALFQSNEASLDSAPNSHTVYCFIKTQIQYRLVAQFLQIRLDLEEGTSNVQKARLHARVPAVGEAQENPSFLATRFVRVKSTAPPCQSVAIATQRGIVVPPIGGMILPARLPDRLVQHSFGPSDAELARIRSMLADGFSWIPAFAGMTVWFLMWSAWARPPLLDPLGDAVLTLKAVAGHGPALAAEDLELVVAAAEP